MNEVKAKKRQKTFFSADVIATTIHLAIKRDLAPSHKCTMEADDPLDYLRQLQSDSFLKKYEFSDTDAERLEYEAFAQFIEANRIMLAMNDSLSKSIPPRCPTFVNPVPEMVLHHLRARNIISHVLGKLSLEEWFSACKHSGGTSRGVSFSDTSPEAKWTFSYINNRRCYTTFLFIYGLG